MLVPQGIRNFGNSCFLNGILQVLLNVGGLQRLLSSWPLSEDHPSLTQCLLALHRKVDHGNSQVLRLLSNLPDVYKLPRHHLQQCDAEECLTQLLEGLVQEFGRRHTMSI